MNERHIEHDLITPYYPESNGKVEALIKIINRECLRWHLMTHHKEQFQSVTELQEALDALVEYYNWYRGHSAILYHTPGSVYAGYQPKRYRLGALLAAGILLGHLSGLEGKSKEPPPIVDQDFRKRHLALVTV